MRRSAYLSIFSLSGIGRTKRVVTRFKGEVNCGDPLRRKSAETPKEMINRISSSDHQVIDKSTFEWRLTSARFSYTPRRIGPYKPYSSPDVLECGDAHGD